MYEERGTRIATASCGRRWLTLKLYLVWYGSFSGGGRWGRRKLGVRVRVRVRVRVLGLGLVVYRRLERAILVSRNRLVGKVVRRTFGTCHTLALYSTAL